jgi:hypothetical protein
MLVLPLPGEEVIIIAVGADYTTWEGGRDPVTGQARIGLSYDKLCRDVKPGGRILLADGSCCVQVCGTRGMASAAGEAAVLYAWLMPPAMGMQCVPSPCAGYALQPQAAACYIKKHTARAAPISCTTRLILTVSPTLHPGVT